TYLTAISRGWYHLPYIYLPKLILRWWDPVLREQEVTEVPGPGPVINQGPVRPPDSPSLVCVPGTGTGTSPGSPSMTPSGSTASPGESMAGPLRRGILSVLRSNFGL